MAKTNEELEKELEDVNKRLSALIDNFSILYISITSILSLVNKVNETLGKKMDDWNSKSIALEAQYDLRHYVKILEEAGINPDMASKKE